MKNSFLSFAIIFMSINFAEASCHTVSAKLTALGLRMRSPLESTLSSDDLSGPTTEVGSNYVTLNEMPIRAVLWVEAINGKGKGVLPIDGSKTIKICGDKLYVGMDFYSQSRRKPFDAYRIEVFSDGTVVDDYISSMDVIKYGVSHNSNEIDL